MFEFNLLRPIKYTFRKKLHSISTQATKMVGFVAQSYLTLWDPMDCSTPDHKSKMCNL